MKSALRPVFLTWVLVVMTVGALAGPLPPNRPNKIYVVLTKNKTIQVENRVSDSPFPRKVWGRVGGTVQFVIENRDSVEHTVTIPLSVAEPKRAPESPKGAPAYPHRATFFVPLVKGDQSITVAAGKDATLTFTVAVSTTYLQFDTRPYWRDDPDKDNPQLERGMTYKYNIYSTPAKGTTIKLDPDIEIRQ